MDKKLHVISGKRIGVFGKGGSGKSTFIGLFARVIQERGCEVCIVDADSTNIGLSQSLGVDSPSSTLLEYFGGMVFNGGKVTCPVDDPTPLENNEVNLDTLSKQYYACSPEGITLLVAGKIGTQGPGAGCDGPISKIARDISLHRLERELVTLIDFKAGFEDSARGSITSLDWAIVVVDPTTASVDIAVNMRNLVHQIQADILPATAHLVEPDLISEANRIFRESKLRDVFFVLNKVPNSEIEDYLWNKVNEFKIKPLGVIHEDPAISLAWLKGTPIRDCFAIREARMIVDEFLACIDDSS